MQPFPTVPGGWYIGGEFTQVGTVARNHIAHILSDGTVEADWNPNASSTVHALAVSGDGSTVYAGGYFTNIAGQTRNHIAAIDATTGNATPWNPNASGTVRGLAVSGDGATVYSGGHFTSIGGHMRNYIAALDATTGVAKDWNPNANEWVQALAVSGDGATVYAGGNFTSLGGQARNDVAALHTTTGAATPWNPDADSNVLALTVSGDGATLYAGGEFWHIGAKARRSFAQFDLTPPPAAPSNPGATAVGLDTITWTWQDNSFDEDGFMVWADPGAAEPTTLRVTTPPDAESWTYNGLAANTEHAFQVAATNIHGASAKTPNFTARTLAETPLAPVVDNPTGTTLDVAIGAGDGNPPYTEYALFCATADQWVQGDGTLGASLVWQTAAVWDTVTVTGLAEYLEHSFSAIARNGAGVETSPGPSGTAWTLDVTPPTGSILINDGAAYTNTTSVLLALSASDAGSGVADMRFSNDGADWSGWEPYDTSKAWTLNLGDGLKTVYA